MSLKDQILSADDLATRALTIKEWGDAKVWIRTLTAAERDAWEQTILEPGKDGKRAVTRRAIRAKLVAACLCDEHGGRVFTDAEAEALGRKSGAVLQRLWDVARRLNKMDEKDVDELEKNSAGGPAADFMMRLALAMGKTVRQLLSEMDSAELAEWMAFARVEPFGDRRADLRNGILASTIFNMLAAGDTPPRSSDDFVPDFWREPEKPATPQDVARKVNET